MPLRSRAMYRLTSALIALASFAVSASSLPAAPQRVAAKPAARSHGRARPAAPKKEKRWTDALKQYDNGAGLLVCDPAPLQADAAAAEFGAGCGRWLHLVVAGHGELGKTPFWSDQEITRKALSRSDLRLTKADLAKMAQRAGISLGITHVALGEISGSVADCTLTYQIWSVPGQKEVGAPLTLRGSAAKVMAGLPMVAMGLCGAVGISKPRIPVEVRESAEELQFLGSIPRVPAVQDPKMPAAQLQEIAARLSSGGDQSKSSPPGLAAFLSMIYHAASGEPSEAAVLAKELARAMPENVLVGAECASLAYELKLPSTVDFPAPWIKQGLERFPNNFALRTAQCRLQLLGDRKTEARKNAEHAVRCATHNPEAWSFLAGLIPQPGEKAAVNRCEIEARSEP
jgi:hypothetical protein